jgi:FtsP/CotA-like multicopper oxidase with cupredoxin domain
MHGMVLPESVGGLPNSQSGLIKPKQTYAYQFVAKPVGTYWYHPQIMHADQKAKGLYGVFIVEPDDPSVKPADQEIIIVLSDLVVEKNASGTSAPAKLVATISGANKSGSPFYLVNGKTAPAIPAIEVRPNTRIRMRIINAGQHAVPLHITGHKFEVVSINGNLTGEQTARDTITCGVSDRIDLEFIANNPGVWSLASELIEQTTTNGQFPGGIVCLLRYVD